MGDAGAGGAPQGGVPGTTGGALEMPVYMEGRRAG